MKKTLKLCLDLKVAYGINMVFDLLKKLPLIGKHLPLNLYSSYKLKNFCALIAIIFEFVSIFLGKFLYYLCFFYLPLNLYHSDLGATFLHIFLLLTLIGLLSNTALFSPDKEAYYAIVDLNVDAREYILTNFCYKLLKMGLGYLVLFIIVGYIYGLNAFYVIVMILGVTSLKIMMAYFKLYYYDSKIMSFINKTGFYFILLLLALAYLGPISTKVMPNLLVLIVFSFAILFVYPFIQKISSYKHYRLFAKRELNKFMNGQNQLKGLSKFLSEKRISDDASISSNKSGLAYLNELFIKRHRSLLYTTSKRQSIVSLGIFLALIVCALVINEDLDGLRSMILSYLSYFVFIMYILNRGSEFTKCLFMNCDHSLLSYAFYKEPANLLKLFRLRLVELIKVNLPPALSISFGLSALLGVSGEREPINYLIIFLVIIMLSIFFSIHHLVLYYLLQPYNLEGVKSIAFSVVSFISYLLALIFMYLRLPNLIFGICTIVFCLVYSLLSFYLVYRFGAKTFKLRN